MERLVEISLDYRIKPISRQLGAVTLNIKTNSWIPVEEFDAMLREIEEVFQRHKYAISRIGR